MDPVIIGYVKYLNTLPLVAGLESSRELRLHPGAPAMLASMLRAGEVDVALASIVDFALDQVDASPGAASASRRALVELTLLPVGMIGCDGPTLTVRLYSRTPFDRVTHLACDVDSHTSVVLARVILSRVFGARPVLETFDAASLGDSAWPDAVLLIGDKVVSGAPPAGTYTHELDLGLAWKELTGLPFVYAMWMARAADLREGSSRREAIRAAAILLERQRRRNLLRLDWIVDRFTPERGWPPELARTYVKDYLRYEPTEESMAAIQRFFDEAAEIGALPQTRVNAWSFELAM